VEIESSRSFAPDQVVFRGNGPLLSQNEAKNKMEFKCKSGIAIPSIEICESTERRARSDRKDARGVVLKLGDVIYLHWAEFLSAVQGISR